MTNEHNDPARFDPAYAGPVRTDPAHSGPGGSGRGASGPGDGRALHAVRPQVIDASELAWQGAAGPEGSAPLAGGGMVAYWHAFRRRWLPAILLGGLLGGAGASALWFSYRPQYTALAAFYIAANRQPILFRTNDGSATAFEIYKNTQQQYVKSRFVLIAALRKPEVANLKLLRDEPDPVAWIARNVSVDFPGNAEIMHISLKADDPQEAAAVVNAVVEAYQTEILSVEQDQQRLRLDELDKIRSEKETELRKKRTELKTLVEVVGSGERDALSMQQQIALQQFAALRSELSATKFKLMRMRWELAAKKATAEHPANLEVTESELDSALLVDPVAKPLLEQRGDLLRRQYKDKGALTPGKGNDYLERYHEAEKDSDRLLTVRRRELREELKAKKKIACQSDVQQLEAEIAVALEQQKQLDAEAQESEKKARSLGSSSIDVEMMRAEIASIEGLLKTVADERDKLLIEIRNKPRITQIQKADPPTAPDRDKKIQLTAAAGMAGFFLPLGLIMWLDVRRRRVSSSEEVSVNTGLDVIGAVPLLPARAAGQPLATAGRHQRLRNQMHESVDGIAARLLHLAERDQTRVVLVSSAVEGEGKTTLATQLALSLARMGHRVAVVDFDLRRPSIDQVFDLPLEPGVAGMLRKEADLGDAMQESQVENLWVLPAGRADGHMLGSLANGAVGAMFAKLREEFDFIVVDGSPILPVVDARFLCKNVDGVVLSVLRDVSSVPKILATCDVLAGFGVRPIGAVVTGSPRDLHYRGTGYLSGD